MANLPAVVSFQPSPIRKPLEGSQGFGGTKKHDYLRHGGKVNILNQFKETRRNSAILRGTWTKNIKGQIFIDEEREGKWNLYLSPPSVRGPYWTILSVSTTLNHIV